MNQENLSSLENREEISLFDKITGIYTEPSNVFENIKIFGAKVSNWFVPTFIYVIITILATFIIMSNPDTKAAIQAEQRKALEERLDKLVEENKITKEQKEEQIATAEKFMSTSTSFIFQSLGILVFTFVFLFLISLVYWLVWVFLLKGKGNFNFSLSVYGLAQMIFVIEVILSAIVALLLSKPVQGISLALMFDLEKGTTLRYFLSKINPFTFWWLYVMGVGLAKVYELDKKKSLFAIIVVWLIYVVIGKFIPFISQTV